MNLCLRILLVFLLAWSTAGIFVNQNCYADAHKTNETAVKSYKQYGIAEVKACGKNMQGNKNLAIENAKKVAIVKALSKFIEPDKNISSVFQKIVNQYSDFTVGKPKLLKEQNISGKLNCFCIVMVDFDKLENALRKQIKSLHGEDDTLSFLVRVKGLEHDEKLRLEAEQMVATKFAEIFEDMNFQSAVADDVIVSAMENLNDKDFQTQILTQIANDVTVGMAIVGNLMLLPTSSDVSGSNAVSVFKAILVENQGDGNIEVIGVFEDKYYFSSKLQNEAERTVLKKAVFNSAKSIFNMALKHWQNREGNLANVVPASQAQTKF